MAAGTYQFVRQVMQSPGVRRSLAGVADRVAAEANRLARQQGLGGVARVDGTRPKGRPYARVLMTGSQEWGTYMEPRRRILGQATASVRGRR
jgi:hypothetical protein